MSYFISHENWNIKTPFVSYNEPEFIKEITSNNSTMLNYYINYKNKNKNKNNKQPSNYFKNYFINRKNNTLKKILLYFKNCIKKYLMF